MKNVQSNVLDDKKIIFDYINGNESSFELLVGKYKNRIYSYIYSKVKNEQVADDIFQEVFIKIIQNLRLGRYNHHNKFINWVFRISHNQIADYFRVSKKEYSQENSSIEDLQGIVTDFSEDINIKIEEEQQFVKLTECIQSLTEEHQELIKLHYFKKMSFKEISRLQGVSINTLLSRSRSAVKHLRKIFENQNLSLDLAV